MFVDIGELMQFLQLRSPSLFRLKQQREDRPQSKESGSSQSLYTPRETCSIIPLSLREYSVRLLMPDRIASDIRIEPFLAFIWPIIAF